MDLIDRNLIGDLVDSHGNVHYEDIKMLPSEEPEWKPGKWIKGYASEHKTCEAAICSECNETYTSKAFEYNFCPNCGCKMRSIIEDNGGEG